MPNGHGGARKGAGRKRLATKKKAWSAGSLLRDMITEEDVILALNAVREVLASSKSSTRDKLMAAKELLDRKFGKSGTATAVAEGPRKATSFKFPSDVPDVFTANAPSAQTQEDGAQGKGHLKLLQ